MKIVHLTNNDFDGAGRAVLTLHRALKEDGVDSTMLVYKKTVNDPSVIYVRDGYPFPESRSIFDKLAYCIIFIFRKILWEVKSTRTQRRQLFNFNMAFTSLKTLKPYLDGVDVICLHSVQQFLSTELICEVYEYARCPIVWTTMDVEPLSGGCHFNHQCERYTQQCGQCPQLGSLKEEDASRENWLKKKELLDNTPVTVVSLSDWTERYIKHSSLLGSKPVRRIYLGLEDDIFKPGDKQSARRELAWHERERIILFGALNLKDERKGGQYLVEALQALSSRLPENETVTLATFGGDCSDFLPEHKNLRWKHLGRINDNRQLALLFQASDVYACPSVDDLGPRVAIEAFVCGLPVVAFNAGISADLIKDEQAGYLAANCDAADFSEGLWQTLFKEKADVNEHTQEMRRRSAASFQAKEYKRMFEELCAQKAGVK